MAAGASKGSFATPASISTVSHASRRVVGTLTPAAAPASDRSSRAGLPLAEEIELGEAVDHLGAAVASVQREAKLRDDGVRVGQNWTKLELGAAASSPSACMMKRSAPGRACGRS